MSNNALPKVPPPNETSVTSIYGSLEDCHNAIHVYAGGPNNGFNGHMSRVPNAAFDPIFWLHHTYVKITR